MSYSNFKLNGMLEGDDKLMKIKGTGRLSIGTAYNKYERYEDEIYPNYDYNELADIEGVFTYGQTFTIGTTGPNMAHIPKIVKVRAYDDSDASEPGIKFWIYLNELEVDGTTPKFPALASGCIDVMEMQASFPGAPEGPNVPYTTVHINNQNNIFQSDTKYAITFSTTPRTGGEEPEFGNIRIYYNIKDGGGSYFPSGGSITNFGGPSWLESETSDYLFTIYGKEIPLTHRGKISVSTKELPD